jgi:D-alanine---D-serine ligase
MDKKNIAVIFGGYSSEYSISLVSAAAVIEHMDRERFTPVLLGITRQGNWYLFQGDPNQIANDTWEKGACIPACISPNRRRHEVLFFRNGGIERVPIDAVFPVLHGRNGEDGTVQGLCALAGIPVAGCGTLSSALCMDKDRAHKLVSLAGVRVPAAVVLTSDMDVHAAGEAAKELGYPLFVKPVRAGSSYGISKVSGPEFLQRAITEAFRYDNRVVLEEAIDGFEVGCAILGNTQLLIGGPDEIELAGGFFDFTEKYNLITSKVHTHARIPAQTAEAVREAARTIYQALDCSGFARVDMFLTPAGEIVFNEVNTIPGFTSLSRFPSMMQTAGLSFRELITRILELAMENRSE